jgi:hypothetical protein
LDKQEIIDEILMPYYELVKYLIEKYGEAEQDYYLTEDCKKKNPKVSRGSEGLYCHHIEEIKAVYLSDPMQAISFPFEWQKKEHLVYCNIIEHLILHIKILVSLQRTQFDSPRALRIFLMNVGGTEMIWQEINDMYFTREGEKAIRHKAYELIRENYWEYIAILKTFLTYLEKNYVGAKEGSPILVPGAVVNTEYGEGEVIEVSNRRTRLRIKIGNREFTEFVNLYGNQLHYLDVLDIFTAKMACGFKWFRAQLYKDLVTYEDYDLVERLCNGLATDYSGYGHVVFAKYVLGDEYGSKNADEYISKALPMHSKPEASLDGMSPIFWKGPIIPPKARGKFYVVRLETMFRIKDGHEPFVRYRENDIIRRGYGPIRRDRTWDVLSTSDIFDRKTGRYFSKYKNRKGEMVDASVILSLGREDYLLFLKEYKIKYARILDGCYFLKE